MEVLGEESDWWPPARPYCWEPVVKVKIAELLVSFKSHKLTFLSKPALATQLWASDDAKHFTKSAWFPSVCIELEDKLWGFHNLMVLSDDAETTNKKQAWFQLLYFLQLPFFALSSTHQLHYDYTEQYHSPNQYGFARIRAELLLVEWLPVWKKN